MELGLGLDVEEEDVGVEGGVDLPDLFAYAGEDYFFEGGLVGFADTFEFATGDDVEACSLLGEETQDGERGVCFDCVADGVGTGGEGLGEELKAVGDLVRGVDVEWGAVFGGKGGEVRSVAVEEAIAVGEGSWAGVCLGRRGGDLFGQDLGALCGKGVGCFGDDDPGGDVGNGADAGEDDHESCEDADEVEVPAIVESEASADAGDHAVVAGAGELRGGWIGAHRRRN